jgi:hypothetical protein
LLAGNEILCSRGERLFSAVTASVPFVNNPTMKLENPPRRLYGWVTAAHLIPRHRTYMCESVLSCAAARRLRRRCRSSPSSSRVLRPARLVLHVRASFFCAATPLSSLSLLQGRAHRCGRRLTLRRSYYSVAATALICQARPLRRFYSAAAAAALLRQAPTTARPSSSACAGDLSGLALLR